MTAGMFCIEYTPYNSGDTATVVKIKCRAVQTMNDNISVSVSQTPIVTYDAENAFVFDTGSRETVSFTLTRVQPADWVFSDDNVTTSQDDDASLSWSNNKWKTELVKAINRWQARSDGCTVSFVPDGYDDPESGELYQLSRNAYLKQVSTTYSRGDPTKMSVSLSFQIGSMRCDSTPRSSALSIGESAMSITMKSSDQQYEYVLYRSGANTGMNCVSEYTITGGMEQPFECLTMKISKKRLTSLAPYLVDDIKPGHNIINVDAMGKGTFVVRKCSSTKTEYKVVAYALSEQYRGITLNEVLTFGGKEGSYMYDAPSKIITYLLTGRTVGSSLYGVQLNYLGRIKYCIRKSMDHWYISSSGTDWTMKFTSAMTFWYVLSVCALRLHAKIWFSEDYVYIIDPSITEAEFNTSGTVYTTETTYPIEVYNKLYLNEEGAYPISLSDTDKKFIKSVVDTPTLGDEGADVLKNVVSVRYNISYPKQEDYTSDYVHSYTDRDTGEPTGDTAKVAASRAMYKDKSQSYDMSNLCYYDALQIAKNIADMNCDAEQSITFGLKEMHTDTRVNNSKWVSYFPMLARATEIIDYNNDLRITNKCNFSVTESGTATVPTLPNKLFLSTYERHFPEGYTYYTFGIISQTDFTQNTSQILTALNNGG